MSHYQHSLILDAPPTTIYAALTTPEGLRGWWTEDYDVATEVGGMIHIHFGPHHKDLRIERHDPDREVHWLCTGAHISMPQFKRKDEWVGTQLVFRMTPDGEGRTRLEFEHIGLVPTFECYSVCRDGWQYYLGSLQQFAETGRGIPYELAAAEAN